jgi:hypothetical protein
MINKDLYLFFNYFLLVIILLFNTSFQSDEDIKIIVLPFKTFKTSDPSTPINISTSLIQNHIYTNLNITNQILIASFNSEEYSFYMTSENCPEDANYIIQNSPSFHNISYGFASERMLLYRDYDLKTMQYGLFQEMRIKEYNNKKQCAIFGLEISTAPHDHNENQNFITNFYTNSNINKTQWTIKYITDDEGLLIIGDSPIKYDPMLKGKKYVEHRANAIVWSGLKNFGIEFDEISMNNQQLSKDKVRFCHDLGAILVNQKIYDEIYEIFFQKYAGCEKKWVFQKYGYIWCDSNNFTDSDMKSFPTIYFKTVEMDYIFELNYQDLFSKQPDGKIYFLIIFDTNNPSIRIGKPFLKKYSLTVDNKEQTISLFLLDDKKEDNGLGTTFYIIILSIVVVILLVVASFFGYKLYLKKNKTKKRANELDEDYEYLSKDNDYKKADYKDTDENAVGNLGI